ncbi:MAG: OsmC family protein [Fimbriimonadaceae bacterium]
MSQVHEYPVSVVWAGGRDGEGELNLPVGGFDVKLGVPAEFGGQGDGTNPEELLAGSVAACYSITFGIIAANRKIPVARMITKAVGEVEQAGASFTYRKITLRPTIDLDPDATDEQMKMAEEMAHKADAYCIITNAVRGKVEIVVEPTLRRAE